MADSYGPRLASYGSGSGGGWGLHLTSRLRAMLLAHLAPACFGEGRGGAFSAAAAGAAAFLCLSF